MTTDITELTAEKLEEIRQRYRPTEVPKCHICGAEMTIQRASASRITYGCTGATYDEQGCHYAEGRSIADDHYAESRITVVDVSDPDVLALVEALEKAQQHIARQEQILLNQDESLSIRRGELEAAQQERESWRTSFDNERFRADKLKAHIDDIEPVRAAAEKLVRCKGRYHSELNYRALAALFGVTTPDLPSLEHENVHYADAAEMEIAALRQRISELESRTVKLPDDAGHDIMAPVAAYLSEKFKWDGGAARWDGRKEYDVLADRVKYALVMVIRRAAGIKVEAD